MKLEVPFRYTEEVIPPRCRKLRRVTASASVTVTVRELAWVDAPIAIVERREDGEDHFVVYRWYRGRLFVRSVDNLGVPHNDPHDYLWYEGKKTRLAGIRAWARERVLICGELWVAVDEPRYVIMTFGLGGNHGGIGTTLSTSTWYNPNIGNSRYYRCDQLAEASAEATRIALARGDTKSVPLLWVVRFEVRMPWVLKLNPGRQHGRGDSFINGIERVIQASGSPEVAAVLVLANLGKELI